MKPVLCHSQLVEALLLKDFVAERWRWDLKDKLVTRSTQSLTTSHRKETENKEEKVLLGAEMSQRLIQNASQTQIGSFCLLFSVSFCFSWSSEPQLQTNAHATLRLLSTGSSCVVFSWFDMSSARSDVVADALRLCFKQRAVCWLFTPQHLHIKVCLQVQRELQRTLRMFLVCSDLLLIKQNKLVLDLRDHVRVLL